MHKLATTGSLLSTGQAAKLCSVTPDTLLKWIKSGRLPARRTAGGHYRVRREEVDALLAHEHRAHPPNVERRAFAGRHFRYCWEFNGKGKLLKGCRECAVYLLRAQRCYEVVKLAPQVGHNKLFCKGSCDQCAYYRLVREQATNLLVVTDNQDLTQSLKREAKSEPFRLEVTDCEYKCSALVEVFRPDFAVIDCSLGEDASRDICHHLTQDPRIPHVRVIMAARSGQFPAGCDKQVFARLDKPFGIHDIAECIRSVSEVAA